MKGYISINLSVNSDNSRNDIINIPKYLLQRGKINNQEDVNIDNKISDYIHIILNIVLDIKLEATDQYNEYPAFQFNSDEHEYILMGTPDFKHLEDFYEEREGVPIDMNSYDFEIYTVGSINLNEEYIYSLVDKINKDGRLIATIDPD